MFACAKQSVTCEMIISGNFSAGNTGINLDKYADRLVKATGNNCSSHTENVSSFIGVLLNTKLRQKLNDNDEKIKINFRKK